MLFTDETRGYCVANGLGTSCAVVVKLYEAARVDRTLANVRDVEPGLKWLRRRRRRRDARWTRDRQQVPLRHTEYLHGLIRRQQGRDPAENVKLAKIVSATPSQSNFKKTPIYLLLQLPLDIASLEYGELWPEMNINSISSGSDEIGEG
ncbi:uncharacterized protein TrAtP1_003470 [Trichoderma atroviride]|uniref:uncharacterized protein n=1 Tax=Hypocrea atroviridis TaxID=63577 RepID=UPI00332F1F0E|nr:hypothetical protein TrAtP1_003470 [Trichoderma atroviride]